MCPATKFCIVGGRVLNAGLVFQNITNAGVHGYSMLYHAYNTILVEYSTATRISDLIALNPRWYAVSVGEVNGIAISSLRSLGGGGNGDGTNIS